MKTNRQTPIEKIIGAELSRILVVVILALSMTRQFVVAQDAQKNSESEIGSNDLSVRIELADAELNLLYGRIIKSLSKEVADSLRTEQREWIKRMEGSPAVSAERLDYLLSRNQRFREFLTKPRGDAPQPITSPDGRSTVRILDAPMPGKSVDSEENRTLEVLQEGNSVIKAATSGYLRNCRWSADGKFLAITNRRGSSGDYVWVVDLDAKKAIKRPDDELGKSWVEDVTHRGGKSADVDHFWIQALYWEKSGVLRYSILSQTAGASQIAAAEGMFDFHGKTANDSRAVSPLPEKGKSKEKKNATDSNYKEFDFEGLKCVDAGPHDISGGPSASVAVGTFKSMHGVLIVGDSIPKYYAVMSRGKALKSSGGQIVKGTTIFPIRFTFQEHNRIAEEDFYFFVDEFNTWKATRVR